MGSGTTSQSRKAQKQVAKRREGVTIPPVNPRTPPAGYNAAAPPRRGPLSTPGLGSRDERHFMRIDRETIERFASGKEKEAEAVSAA